MDERLYNKTISCPVCNKKFDITKVKSKTCRIASKDSDFCVYYEDLNPIFYEIWVCEHCGYAAQADKFEGISTSDSQIVLKNITRLWNKRSFSGERTIDNALESFKLALLNLQLRKAKGSELAKVCIRIAWLYRMKKDEKEKDFLKFALKGYKDAYETERFPIDKFDEFTCMYMIAELSRRVGDLDESVKWFSKLISSPEARKNQLLLEAARDQFMLVRGELDKAPKDETTSA